MRTYTDQDIDRLLQRNEEMLKLEGSANMLERARQAASARGRASCSARIIAIAAVCALLLTFAVFADEIAQAARELYRFTVSGMQVSVVNETPREPGDDYFAGGEIANTERLFMPEGFDWRSERREVYFASIADVQTHVPFPLPIPDFGADAELTMVLSWVQQQNIYREGVYLGYSLPGTNNSYHFSVDYIGPDAYYNKISTLRYQPVDILGVEGICYTRIFADFNDEHVTWYEAVCNRLHISFSGRLTAEQTLVIAERVLEQALAIDWDEIEAELAKT